MKCLSFRWLLTKHRYDDAKKVVQRFAKSNNTKLNEDLWSEVVSNLETKVRNYLLFIKIIVTT